MKKIVLGMLAHVDAGKTTLSEAVLYNTGAIRKLGRVDKKDAFLDTDELEKKRGITIFSKQAELSINDLLVTLLDTPGHVDFGAEMERTLQVLDYAVLVVSGADGVQGHTETLWKLLKRYDVPAFIFVNKMDQPGVKKELILSQLKNKLSDACIDFIEKDYEEIALCEERLLDTFFETGKVEDEDIVGLIRDRKLFPCFFGSALKNEGVDKLLEAIYKYSYKRDYPEEFGARCYKVSRDSANTRLTHLKISGGSLKAKDVIAAGKIDQIRIYSGEKYKTVNEVKAGTICAVTGLEQTYAGQGFGFEDESRLPLLTPVLSYDVNFEGDTDAYAMLPKFKLLEEEIPELHVEWNALLGKITLQMMGSVQLEVIEHIFKERFLTPVTFGNGNITYKETIENVVEGVGHFEPLRHYAEVHLLMEPLPRDSGIVIETNVSEDVLDKNWQRLIVTHLYEKSFVGVLTGSVLTDVKITLVAGRAHDKHTEGGDFRQATYRAVRQGLLQAKSVLLEPVYEFEISVPENCVGRAMTDLGNMGAKFELSNDVSGSVIVGQVPVAALGNYQTELASYTSGKGVLNVSLKGYEPCQNADEVIEKMQYDPLKDTNNPGDSVFCSHGSGFVVPWNEVFDYMHLESIFDKRESDNAKDEYVKRSSYEEEWMGTDEVDAIIEQTFYANRKNTKKYGISRKNPNEYAAKTYRGKNEIPKYEKSYILVDGYNIIFAWDNLKEIAKVNLDGARGKLLDILCNYRGLIDADIIAVFDAYKVKGHTQEMVKHNNISVVYTKEAQTADSYIERFADENSKKYNITVATSDGLEQLIITGKGCKLWSAREFAEEVSKKEEDLRENYIDRQKSEKSTLKEAMQEIFKEEVK